MRVAASFVQRRNLGLGGFRSALDALGGHPLLRLGHVRRIHDRVSEHIQERIRERAARCEREPSPLRRTVRGDVMRAWRVALVMTQREVAALLGVTVRTVKRVEGARPGPHPAGRPALVRPMP